MPDPTPNTPLHVAIIMDGNGRWAKQKGLPRGKGHEAGAESVRAVIRACRPAGVKYLTLYAFSVENWSRPVEEVSGLWSLLVRFLGSEEKLLHEEKIRLSVIGRIEDLPLAARQGLLRTMKETAHHENGRLILALSYGGRTEIAAAARRIAEEAKAGRLEPEQVDEALFGRYLYAPDVPDPDLLIRTSGEIRLSNFLLWQLSYAELYFTPVLWPDFREEQFREALREYGRRLRRFGDVAPENKP
ncbi:MAG: polyprenyl diphosphate synthase [Kiritimatiellia bacterium]